MRVAIFGMGYVGTVMVALLAEHGHTVIGVDVKADKLTSLAAGRAPFYEPGLDEILARVAPTGRLQPVLENGGELPLQGCGLLCVCVGTPSLPDGAADLRGVRAVLTKIGQHLAGRDDYPVVVLRSTVPPAALPELLAVLERASGKRAGEDFGFVTQPEFLREGAAIADFCRPPFTLIGSDGDERAVQRLYALYRDWVAGGVEVTGRAEALMVKYVSNAWHALKVAFANEMGLIAAHLGLSGAAIMHSFTQDTALNISPAYLRPGFAYGGSCLPKDVAALLAMAGGLDLPVLEAIPWSNQARIDEAVERVLATRARRVALIGLSFKPGTDDLRSSPYIEVARQLLAEGIEVRCVDPEVHPERAGEWAERLVTLEEVSGWAECWVIGKPAQVAGRSLPGVQIWLQ